MFNKLLVNKDEWIKLLEENVKLEDENNYLSNRVDKLTVDCRRLGECVVSRDGKQHSLIKELDKKNVELKLRNKQLAKAKKEVDSLYKLINLLDN